jgi:hypothetical protein
LKGSPEGDQPLDYKQKLRKSLKIFLTLPKELFKIWEPYKGGRFFSNQSRIFHEMEGSRLFETEGGQWKFAWRKFDKF